MPLRCQSREPREKKETRRELNEEIIDIEMLAECGRGKIHCKGQCSRTGDRALSLARM